MNTCKLLLLFSAFASGTVYAGGQWECRGDTYLEGMTYKFEVYPGEKDRWDSAKHDAPPVAPGKPIRAAQKFVAAVPLMHSMKEWSIQSISLERLSPSPDEKWVYVVHFYADLKPNISWEGPPPWIDVPVRMDGTIPEPVVEKKKKKKS